MPNRILKERICRSDEIDQLTWMEEVLYYRLIVNCDDFGRFDGRISIIKNTLFPLKENMTAKSVKCAIDKLVTVGLVVLYEFEGKPYLQLPTWDKHQTIRAKKSKYPPFDRDISSLEINCKQLQSNVPVIQSESESYSESSLTTTTTSRGCARVDSASESREKEEPPLMIEVLVYFSEELCVDNAAKEAEKFGAYNAKRGWDCLPDWRAAADLWAARIEDKA